MPGPAPPKGIVCSRCGGRLVVVYTRHPAPGITTRRRFCPRCKVRVTTYERFGPGER